MKAPSEHPVDGVVKFDMSKISQIQQMQQKDPALNEFVEVVKLKVKLNRLKEENRQLLELVRTQSPEKVMSAETVELLSNSIH